MKRSTSAAHPEHHHLQMTFLTMLGGIFIGVVSAFFVLKVFAQSSDVGVIHGCFKNENGLLRVLKTDETCQKGETPLDWNIKGPPGSAGVSAKPYTAYYCEGCYLVSAAERFKGQDMSNSTIINSTFEGADLSGTNFSESKLDGVNFRNTNLTNVNFSNSNIPNWISVSAEFTNANLTGANFTNTNLSNSWGVVSANVTGVIWNNTICPDGTSSNSNGNTCVGHLGGN